MKVAITGSAGRLGRALQQVPWPAGITLLPWTRADADLSKPEQASALFARAAPDVVVHLASSTDLVRCERDRAFAWENVALPALHVVRGCLATGARLVHLSTDYVFSGREAVHPIPAETAPDPTHAYAVCKVAAELAARAVPDHCVVRTSLKAPGPWKHAQAPVDMWQSILFYDEAAPLVRDLALSRRQGVVHLPGRDVNVFEYAASTRADVKPVKRADIGTLVLPGDVRLKANL